MRRALEWTCLALLLLPAFAYAAESGLPSTILDFTTAGPLKEYLNLSKSTAMSYAPLAVLLAVIFEVFGLSPTAKRDFASVVWRIAIIMALFVNYQRVFGVVIQVADGIATKMTPGDSHQEYGEYLAAYYDAAEGATRSGVADSLKNFAQKWTTALLGDGLMGLLLVFAKAIVMAVITFGRILAATLFILGPLALIAGIPRLSATGTLWFKLFVGVATWPIIGGVLLGVMTAVAKASVKAGGTTFIGLVVAVIVTGFCALGTPVLAHMLVGGAIHHVSDHGRDKLTKNLNSLKDTVTKFLPVLKGTNGLLPTSSGGGGRGLADSRGGGGRNAANPPGSPYQGRSGGTRHWYRRSAQPSPRSADAEPSGDVLSAPGRGGGPEATAANPPGNADLQRRSRGRNGGKPEPEKPRRESSAKRPSN